MTDTTGEVQIQAGQKLPNEILVMIFEHLEAHQDALNFLLLIKACYGLCLPILYRNVSIDYSRLSKFERSLRDRPQLASLVNHFSHTGISTCTSSSGLSGPRLFKSRRSVSPAALTDDRHIAVILGFFTHVKALDLILEDSPEWRILEALKFLEKNKTALCCSLFPSKVSTEMPLARLERLTITAGRRPALWAGHFVPLVRLPSLRTIKVSGFYENNILAEQRLRHSASNMTLSKSDRTSGVKELYFQSPCNGSQGFRDFVTACSSLQVFEYHHSDHINGTKYPSFEPRAIYNTLSTHKDSLQILRLSTTRKQQVPPSREAYFGSLKSFTQLRELRLPSWNLLDFTTPDGPTVNLQETLPPSLEILSIDDIWRQDWGDLVLQIRRMVMVRRRRFPAWEKLSLHVDGYRTQPKTSDMAPGGETAVPDAHKMLASLKTDCEHGGIEVLFET